MSNNMTEWDSSNPSFSDIIEKGYPAEWIPVLCVSFIFLVIIIILDVKVIRDHKKYSIKHTLQFLCTIGILQVYPLFAIMYTTGMLIPKSLSTCTFIAESYEAISFLFFLRLILTYMGGKKVTKLALKGEKAHLNVPPLCCCICLPHVTFSRTLFVLNELCIIQFVVIQLVLGFVELLLSLDGSTSYPANLVEAEFSQFYHILLLISLFISIYGLSGIYHAAEHELEHHSIFKKFIAYKILVSLAKAQDVFVSIMSIYDGFGDIASGAFSSELRAHNWFSLLVVAECLIAFVFAIHYYSPRDYPTAPETNWRPMKGLENGGAQSNLLTPNDINVEAFEKNEELGMKDLSSVDLKL